MINALQFNLTCPACGGLTELVTTGRFNSREVSAIVLCSECREEWVVAVSMTSVTHDPTLPGERKSAAPVALCGTDSGYTRHLRRLHEEACPACKKAHSEAETLRMSKHKRAGVFL